MTITTEMMSSSFDIDIIDNMIQDGDKVFNITIRLISTCLPVTINSNTTRMTIIDDEGIVTGLHCTSYGSVYFAPLQYSEFNLHQKVLVEKKIMIYQLLLLC